jgi:hypothetical protein
MWTPGPGSEGSGAPLSAADWLARIHALTELFTDPTRDPNVVYWAARELGIPLDDIVLAAQLAELDIRNGLPSD